MVLLIRKVWAIQPFTSIILVWVIYLLLPILWRLKLVAHFSQLKTFRRRKNLLFIRMKFGMIVMCCIIIFLAWLQDWLPKKERQFWTRGMSFHYRVSDIRAKTPELKLISSNFILLTWNLTKRTSMPNGVFSCQRKLHRLRWVQETQWFLSWECPLHKYGRQLQLWLSEWIQDSYRN